MRELYVGTFDCACYISSTGAGFWPKVAGEARRMAFYNCLRGKNVILTLYVSKQITLTSLITWVKIIGPASIIFHVTPKQMTPSIIIQSLVMLPISLA